MTTKVFDTFTGTAGTDLATHTPDTDVVGTGWVDRNPNEWELDGSGGAQAGAAGESSWIDAGTSDQWGTVSVNKGGADNRLSIKMRRDNAVYVTRSCYEFNFRGADNLIKIYETSTGTVTEIASGPFTISNSTTYSLEPIVNGSTIDFQIDGSSELSVTDTTHTAGTYAGLVHQLFTDGNLRIYDFQIDDTAPAGGTTPKNRTLYGPFLGPFNGPF